MSDGEIAEMRSKWPDHMEPCRSSQRIRLIQGAVGRDWMILNNNKKKSNMEVFKRKERRQNAIVLLLSFVSVFPCVNQHLKAVEFNRIIV